VLVSILGALDIILGAALVAAALIDLAGNGWLFIFAIIALLKGLYSVLAAAGAGFFLDVLGWLDLAVGICLLLANWGIAFPFFLWVGIFMIIKGIYSFIMGIVSSAH
jgi:hypothetical protein